MFVCILFIYLIEISFLLTVMFHYVTISSPGIGANKRSNGKLRLCFACEKADFFMTLLNDDY